MTTDRRLIPSDLGELDPEIFEGLTIVAIVPATADIEWAADCTWQIARAVAGKGRRVALADLAFDRPTLDRDAESVPAEGIVDAFLFGASLSKVAQPQRASGLHYLAVGTRPPDPHEVWASPRWERLAQGFAREQAMLLAFIPPNAVGSLAIEPDGVVVLSKEGSYGTDVHVPEMDAWLERGIPLVAQVSDPIEVALSEPVSPPPAPPPPAPPPVPPLEPVSLLDVDTESAVDERRTPPEPAVHPIASPPVAADPADEPPVIDQGKQIPVLVPDHEPVGDEGVTGTDRRPNRRVVIVAVVGLVVVLGVLAGPPILRTLRPPAPRPDRVAAVPPVPPGDPTTPGQDEPEAPPPAEEPSPTVTTAQAVDADTEGVLDSLFYSAQVAAFNDVERAMAFADDVTGDDLVSAVTPVRIGQNVWFRVIIGAASTAEGADSMLRDLWRRGVVEMGQGTIMRTPQTLDLGASIDGEEARTIVRSLRERGVPAYVLSAPDGPHVFVGAFERPEQAGAAESLLAGAGITATLTPRMGITR